MVVTETLKNCLRYERIKKVDFYTSLLILPAQQGCASEQRTSGKPYGQSWGLTWERSTGCSGPVWRRTCIHPRSTVNIIGKKASPYMTAIWSMH